MRDPLRTAENRLLRIARRPVEHVALAFAHGQRKGGKHVGDEIEKQNLQGQDRQGQRGQDRQADDQHLAQIARQQIGDEAPDIAEDDAPFANGLDDGREGVVEQDHRGRLARDVGAAHAHRHADIGLAQRGRVVDAVAGHGDDVAGRLIGAHKIEFFGRAHARENAGLEERAGFVLEQRL